MIVDAVRFTQDLIPKYFNHKNMASFIRQLNLCEFLCTTYTFSLSGADELSTGNFDKCLEIHW